MNNNAEFISDERKLSLQAGDLFDRVINLKIICRDENGNTEEFVIRSDYELILPDSAFYPEHSNKGYIIRKCTYKPSIKVQCKMVTSNVGTSISVTVSNFFMLTKDGQHLRSFNASQYTIIAVEVVMGYWGQLKDSLNPDTATIKDYFDIKAIKGADRIVISAPIVVTTDKLPPDSAIRMHGYVAGIYTDPVAITNINTPIKALQKPVATSGTDIETIFFENITRRYLNNSKLVATANGFSTPNLSPVEAGKATKVGNKEIKAEDSGLLSMPDAKDYGVQVFLSDEVKKSKLKELYDSEGNKVETRVYFEAGWTIGQTVTRIMSYIDQELEFTFSLEGDILIYTPKEMQDVQALNEAYTEQGMYKGTVLMNKELYNGRLPAVYNINIDAVATIVCPFFTFIQPFQYVEFASRYALTSVVSYYASYNPTIYRFLVISASISFATVDEVNEVQLTAVSAKDSAV